MNFKNLMDNREEDLFFNKNWGSVDQLVDYLKEKEIQPHDVSRETSCGLKEEVINNGKTKRRCNNH